MVQTERGSATVELAIGASLLSVTMTGLIAAAYLGFAHIWIKHASYEAAVCLASQELQSVCRSRLETSINGVLIGRPLKNVQLGRFKRKTKVSFEVGLLGRVSTFESRTLTLPLRQKKGTGDGFLDFQI